MSKRTAPPSKLGPNKKPSTGLSEEKLEIPEPLICRGTSAFAKEGVPFMYQVSLHLEHLSRGQAVLLDKIESIAAKVEILSKEVKSMKAKPSLRIETNKPDNSWLPSDKEIEEWLNMPIQSPERGSFMDLTCSETLYPAIPPSNVQVLESDGSGDDQEWVKVDWRMKNSKQPMSRIQEPSGGTDTYAKKTL